jgi:uncharacterized membrane protein
MEAEACPHCKNSVPSNIRELAARENRNALRKRHLRQILAGAFFIAGGFAVSAISYAIASASSGGGRYFIMIGMVVVGGFNIIKGVAGLISTVKVLG